MIVHPIPPIYDSQSELLILGSFPSVRSREDEFFYAHPQNRFWRVMARVCDSPLPITRDEKTALMLSHHIALWDVIHSCELVGSADSTIRNVVPNDIAGIIRATGIRRVFVNGKKAESLYIRYLQQQTGLPAEYLPSTSPANAAWSEDKLVEYWSKKLNI